MMDCCNDCLALGNYWFGSLGKDLFAYVDKEVHVGSINWGLRWDQERRRHHCVLPSSASIDQVGDPTKQKHQEY